MQVLVTTSDERKPTMDVCFWSICFDEVKKMHKRGDIYGQLTLILFRRSCCYSLSRQEAAKPKTLFPTLPPLPAPATIASVSAAATEKQEVLWEDELKVTSELLSRVLSGTVMSTLKDLLITFGLFSETLRPSMFKLQRGPPSVRARTCVTGQPAYCKGWY